MIDQKSQPQSAAAATVRTASRGFISDFCHSSVGRKMIIAVTGVILIPFVIGHLLGNLQIFLGPEWINAYSQHLRDLGPLLWLIRAFLLTTVILHIYFIILLAIENRRARPEPCRRLARIHQTGPAIMTGNFDARIPSGPLDRNWTSHKDHSRLASLNNLRKIETIVVGSGPAGGSAPATFGALGSILKCFCYRA